MRKAELIALLHSNPPRKGVSAGPPAPHVRPPRPTRPPPPPPPQLVSFMPDRPRQPELMRRLEGISTPKLDKPYQLKPKRDAPIEGRSDDSIDHKKLKRMKKKLDELNRKIRHSRKKHDGIVHKRNALRKVIDEIKHGSKPLPPKPDWNFKEHKRAFNEI